MVLHLRNSLFQIFLKRCSCTDEIHSDIVFMKSETRCESCPSVVYDQACLAACICTCDKAASWNVDADFFGPIDIMDIEFIGLKISA